MLRARACGLSDVGVLRSHNEDCFEIDPVHQLFVVADEIVARAEMYHLKNQLKNFITGEWVRINPKNVAAHRERNHMNIVFLSNERLAQVLGTRARSHSRFGTAKVILDPATHPDAPPSLDFVTARTEFYERPTELPQVERSSIKKDLYRREFTIKAEEAVPEAIQKTREAGLAPEDAAAGRVVFRVPENMSLYQALDICKAQNMKIVSVAPRRETLEEVFVRVVGSAVKNKEAQRGEN